MAKERDYVLGTHDDEVARLGLQHRVWRPRALDAWYRAGFSLGRTLLDVGSGPGHASFDLAQIAGPRGKVVALERSRRFLDSLEEEAARRGIHNIETREIDLEQDDLPALEADGAWSRWFLAFVKHPEEVLAKVHRALRPGAPIVLHEYFDYRMWRLAPRVPELEEFVDMVMETWRASGGEPDIGLDLPRLLRETGFEIASIAPIVHVVPKSSYVWEWPRAFVDVGLRRFVDLKRLTAKRAQEIADAVARGEAEPGALMITPGVLEIIARRA
jgi:SAM-dependent methyltransferase